MIPKPLIINISNLLVAVAMYYFVGCRQDISESMHRLPDTTYYNSKQDQFTFLVFDKAKVDSFMKNHQLAYNEKNTEEAYTVLMNLRYDAVSLGKTKPENSSYESNTHAPDYDSYHLACDVLKSAYKEKNKEHFSAAFDYLFFYECLPNEFRYKWHQSVLGHFEFNSTFFALLRERSAELDEFLCSARGHWDEKMVFIFEGYIFNEITPEMATTLKKVIEGNKVFEDARFKQDKNSFVHFLDKVIIGEWRMIMIDWD